MKDSFISRIVIFFFSFLVTVSPVGLQAGEIDSSRQEIDPGEIIEAPKQITQKDLNDLLGEDPYLGQTSYLQSPDGFSQRDKSK